MISLGRILGVFLCAAITAGVVGATAARAAAAVDVVDWLMRMEMAPDKVNYIGSFIYDHDGKMETLRVAHRVNEGGFEQRLFSLTGSAREIIRDNESVWCFLPDKKIGVHEYRQASRHNFLQISGDRIRSLDDHYFLTLGEIERIADRPARVIEVMPRDDYRYGYSLWVDTETGLLLRSDLLDTEGSVVERYMFVDISIGTEITDRDLTPRTARDSLSWFGIDEPGAASTEEMPMRWTSRSLPAGFELSHSINRRDPMEERIVEHHVFSDGLSSVSVFVKEADGDDGATGLSRMGAVSAFLKRIDGFAITVMGEVPEPTVTMIAEGVVRLE